MSDQIPRRPWGSSAKWIFMGRVWDKCFGPEGRIINSDTVKVSYTTKGIRLDAAPAGSGGSKIIQCVITELYGVDDGQYDYIGVTEIDLSSMTLIGTQFNCAKCYTGRQPGSDRVDGQIATYSNYNEVLLPEDSQDNVRLANFSLINSEYQVMNPRYLQIPDDLTLPTGADISQYLIKVTTLQNNVGMVDGAGAQILYIETDSSRNWCWSPFLNGGND